MAFFFCDFKDPAKQNIRALLSSLVVQLSYQSDSFYKILHDFYSTHRDGSQQPSVEALTQCLENMLKVPGKAPIYLIIDALDECLGTSGIKSPREKVLGLVTALVELHISSLRLCVTSRPEFDIRAILEPLATTFNRISLFRRWINCWDSWKTCKKTGRFYPRTVRRSTRNARASP